MDRGAFIHACVCVYVCLCVAEALASCGVHALGSSCTSCCFHCGAGLKKADLCASVSVSQTKAYQTVLINTGANCLGFVSFSELFWG